MGEDPLARSNFDIGDLSGTTQQGDPMFVDAEHLSNLFFGEVFHFDLS